MGRRANISRLPEDVKTALDERLRANGYSQYHELSLWLTEAGYPISKSAIHRYGQALERTDALTGFDYPALRRVMSEGYQLDQRESEILIELGRIRVYEWTLLNELKHHLAEKESED